MNNMTINSLAVGIVYKEKAKLDWLAMQVAEAQYEVDQYQAIVDAETAKSIQFNDYLTAAEANKTAALTNFNLAIDIDSSVNALCTSTGLALKQTGTATREIKRVSGEMATLINKLIFTVELIDRFGQLVNKQKLSNPLIPDTLISFMAKATTDANNAVALTLTALQSCYVAEATSLRSEQIITLENDQVTTLKSTIERQALVSGLQDMTGLVVDGNFIVGFTPDCTGVLALVQQAYNKASEKYNQALANVNIVNQQLAYAQSALATATTSLNSYKAGLAAATAAAYAA
ncbi:MAG: hypothetical protein KJ556_04140 [Gammaproteobacteria bacterium]|nr:hypothetical protein [Gammaproteobacteria bacterium]MBU2057944.1 hypothetical protein [Gammaproteobacteria bacterium]MBU2174296.1 hypothetical protein [Gammaproteobacteria bacterium]MBU2247753.1 hypothetical protein [Gammaproteobacteria bacterium]MBU2344279.1 hypothetical protein [Gammaproteobacteria bacterium]